MAAALRKCRLEALVSLAIAAACPAVAAADQGWYLGAGAAASFVKPQDFSLYGFNGLFGIQDGLVVGNATPGTGWTTGLSAGYTFASGFRGELELDYRRNDFSKLIRSPITATLVGPTTVYAGAVTTDVGGFENTDTVLLNLWYDFRHDGWFHPYLGIGAGAARVALRHPSYDQTVLNSWFDMVPAYQAGAGADVDLGRHWVASLDYRHLETYTSAFRLTDDQPGTESKATYRANTIGLGIRYSFGVEAHPSAPPPAEAPVQVVPVQQAAAAPPAPPCQPPVPGQPISLEGCREGDVIVLRGVNFNFNKASLLVNSKTLLDMLADALLARPDIQFEIDGHTDGIGSLHYNQKLSERRADSVKQYLIGRGVAADRMTARGFGKTQPVADNNTEEGRELNRRVELKITAVNPPPAAESAAASGSPAAPAAPPAAEGSVAPPAAGPVPPGGDSPPPAPESPSTEAEPPPPAAEPAPLPAPDAGTTPK